MDQHETDLKKKEEEQRKRTEKMNHMGAIPDEAETGPKPAAQEQREGDPKGGVTPEERKRADGS
jgi:hypothetical protein